MAPEPRPGVPEGGPAPPAVEGRSVALPDAAHRDAARLVLDANAVVEAGAGTGKTTILTERMLFLLLAGGPDKAGIPLPRLVALTFTEKAAGELKLRLASRLAGILRELDDAASIGGTGHGGNLARQGSPGGEAPRVGGDAARVGEERALARRWLGEAAARFGAGPERVRAMAEAAVADMDRAAIGTIHQFAARLLKLFPIEAGVDPNFEVDEGAALKELFEAEWAAWLDRELAADGPRRAQWLEVLNLAPLGDLAELARALCDEEVVQGQVGATPELAARVAEIAAGMRALSALPEPGGSSSIKKAVAETGPRLEELAAETAAAVAEAAGTPAPGTSGAGRPLPEERLFRAKRVPAWPKAWAGLPGREAYERGSALDAASSAVAERLVRRAAALVRPFADALREKHRRGGWIGFAGLLARCRDLLKSSQAVREEVKGRFDALLIDEFQDTDPLQGEIILYAGEKKGRFAAGWRDLEVEPGKLFIVGDPKQSIYRFRGADMRAYGEFTGLLLAQGAIKCDLQTSFRSGEGIVGPVNAVFSRVMREAAGLQPRYLPVFPRPAAAEDGPAGGRPEPLPAGPWVRAGRAADACAVSLALVRDGRNPGAAPASGRRQRAEAAWIASWIGRHCGPGRERRLRDVAILLRTTTPLGRYLAALKEAGIRTIVESDRFFYATQEVSDFLNLLRVLADPEDRVSLAGVLRSPLGGLDDRAVYALCRAGRLSYLEDPPPAALAPALAGARPRLVSLYAQLRALSRFAGREPLGDFVGRVLRETFILELGGRAYHGEQSVSNLMKFGRMAGEAGERGSTLAGFIGRAAAAMRESAEEGESPLAEASFDAVRIMTFHKAKGLEFPVVILPNLTAPKGAGGERPSARVDWSSGTAGLRLAGAGAADAAMALIEAEEAERESHEACRLLYVAMTRARERLILLGGAVPGNKTALSSWLERAGAWPAVKPPLPPSLDLGHGAFISVEEVDADMAGPRSGSASLSGRGPGWAEPARRWLRRAAERDALEKRRVFTSPTARLGEPGKALVPLEEDAPAAAEPALVGRVCHKALEDWDFRGVPAADKAAASLAWLSPEADWARVEREARAILEGFAASAACAELAGCRILGREVPFLCPAGEGSAMRGSMDLLYRDRAGALWVADFKTERQGPEGLSAARHAGQGRDYVEAVFKALGERPRFKLIFLREGTAEEIKV